MIFNPSGFGPQSSEKCGSNGNIWADPKFVDPDNGDFRIAADSPCVDAGDGTVAPELDYYGQPRMDVKGKAATGVPNADGICPDIGIYECPGKAPVPLPDVRVLSVVAPESARVGERLEVTYVVSNVGQAVFGGLVRDQVTFAGGDPELGGETVAAEPQTVGYALAAGATCTNTASVVVPGLKAGQWRLSLMVNAFRDVYEAAQANNVAAAERILSVEPDSIPVGGTRQLQVPAGGTAGFSVTGLPADDGAVLLTLPAGVTASAAVGYVPTAGQGDVSAVKLEDGRSALILPAHAADEIVYVTLSNDTMQPASVGVTAAASAAGLTLARPDDVEVVAQGADVAYSLVMPTSVRNGRVYAVSVEYANRGDAPADLPIFSVANKERSAAAFAATADGPFSAEPIDLIGLSPSAPCGQLKPGERGRVTFYMLSSGSVSLSCQAVGASATEHLNGFATVGDYRAAMSAAATRLCARGAEDPDFLAVLKEALAARRGAANAALCGVVRNALTGAPLADRRVTLVSTNDELAVSVSRTGANGEFALPSSSPGAFRVEVQGADVQEPAVYELNGTDVTGVRVRALPLGSVTVTVSADGIVAPGAPVALDALATQNDADWLAGADDGGVCTFDALPDGDYRLVASPWNGYCLTSSEVFRVSAGAVVVRDLVYLEKGVVFSGKVTAAEAPGPGTNDYLVITAEGGTSYSVQLDEDGSFSFDGVPAGRYGIRLRSACWQLQEGLGEDLTGEAVERSFAATRMSPFLASSPVGPAPHTTVFVLADGVSEPKWDFDGDGEADSTDASPEWTFETLGVHPVTLDYMDAEGVRRTYTSADAVTVIEPIENKPKANGVVLEHGGAVTATAFTTNSLTLRGTGAGDYPVGTVVGQESGTVGGFVFRITGAPAESGGSFTYPVEPAELGDLFETYYFRIRSNIPAENLLRAARASGAEESLRRALRANGPASESSAVNFPVSLSWTVDKVLTFTGSGRIENDSAVVGEMTCYRDANGHEHKSFTKKESCRLVLALRVESAEKLEATGMKAQAWTEHWSVTAASVPAPWGFWYELGIEFELKAGLSLSGYGVLELSGTMSHLDRYEIDDGKQHATPSDFNFSPGLDVKFGGKISASLEFVTTIGSYLSWMKVFAKVGIAPKVGLTCAIEQDVNVDLGEALSSGGSEGVTTALRLRTALWAGAEATGQLLSLASTKLLEKNDNLLTKRHAVELPGKLTWNGTLEVGEMDFSSTVSDLTATFTSQPSKLKGNGFVLGAFDGRPLKMTGYSWDYGDGVKGSGEATASHTYGDSGSYAVTVSALSELPTSLWDGKGIKRKATHTVNVQLDEDEPEPKDEEDSDDADEKISCDPNEIVGPSGVGDGRYVKQGEWMTYTIYFENKADAEAPAQEIYVTNALSALLDWSTFEVVDVAFGDQIDVSLAGRGSGRSLVAQASTGLKVQTTVSLDAATGEARWYLRSWDPSRAAFGYWPANDDLGILPPNDPETHCGEGHLTYRIRVREDAPTGSRIDNSATIVFDHNDPIETDPSWWNTVGQMPVDPEPVDPEPVDPEPVEPEPVEPVPPPALFAAVAPAPLVSEGVAYKGATYNGFLGDETFGGTFTLVVKKPKKGETTAAATLTRVNPATGRKEKVTGTVDLVTGVGTNGLEGLVLNARGVGGKLGDLAVQGAVDAAKAKDAEALSLMGGYDKSVYSVVLTNANGSCALLTATFSKKGKVKVAGTVDGVKISCSAQMSVGDKFCAVPFAYAKPAKGIAVSAVLWFDKATRKLVDVTGVGAGVAPTAFGDASAPDSGEYRFLMAEADVLASVQGAISNTAYEVTASFDGKKYDAGKAAKVTYDKKTSALAVDTSKGTDVSGLKLKYAKGAISGSFTVYEVDAVKQKLVKNKFTVNGVIVNGVGHGLGTSKKLKPIPIEVVK